MNIEIHNPMEDQYGNSKENIFLAFDDKGSYLGSAYTYPAVNHYQTHETPYIIFISITVEDTLDKSLREEVRQKLFDKVLLRAKDLRGLQSDLKARIYSGFEYNEDLLNFYISNGFDEDYSIVMETDIPQESIHVLPDNVQIIDCNLDSESAIMEYKRIYDGIFVTPLDTDGLIEQRKEKHFKNFSLLIDGKLQGGGTVFEKDGTGYIETLFVLPEAMGKGLSKVMVNYILDYFLSKGLKKSRLEVWQLNRRALELYKSFGYTEIKRNLMFPGITL